MECLAIPTKKKKKTDILSYDALPQLYAAPIPVQREKREHLMDIKVSLNEVCYSIYDSLRDL